NLFNEILGIEEKALTSSEFRDISVNDMHILEAVGTEEPRSMSSVAKSLSVTVGTLTIAMNNLVKKGYVNRARSEEDRRVVLISLSEKGEKAYYHHQKFHDDMIQAIMTDLDETQMDALTQALNKLRAFFRKY
ncbi:MarR family winged helix-turn-helix transcriptional regulator, partial [Blautia hydrogenotrophica]